MDDTGLDAWIVANLPDMALWIALGLAIVAGACRAILHFGRDAREWDHGYHDGQRMRAHYRLDDDDPVC